MRQISSAWMGVLVLVAMACQSNKTNTVVSQSEELRQYETRDNQVMMEQLTQAVKDVETSVSLLSQTNNAMATQLLAEDEKAKALERAKEVPERFEKRASLQWFGPLNQLVERIGMLAEYQVKIVGAPVQPLMIKLDMTDVPIIEMYRSIKYQVGNRAVITADNQQIHVTYPSQGL